MLFSLITPEKSLLEVEASLITAPGVEGEFGAMDGHAPFVSLLKSGIITVEAADGAISRVAVDGGVAEVTSGRFVVLTERARVVDGISVEDALAEIAVASAA